MLVKELFEDRDEDSNIRGLQQYIYSYIINDLATGDKGDIRHLSIEAKGTDSFWSSDFDPLISHLEKGSSEMRIGDDIMILLDAVINNMQNFIEQNDLDIAITDLEDSKWDEVAMAKDVISKFGVS